MVFMAHFGVQSLLPCAQSLALSAVNADAGSETVAVPGSSTSVANDVVQKYLETKRSHYTKTHHIMYVIFYDNV